MTEEVPSSQPRKRREDYGEKEERGGPLTEKRPRKTDCETDMIRL